MEALQRKIRKLAQNEIIKKSYLDEKRRLERRIIKDNLKNEVTQNMINTMYGEEPLEIKSPFPKYKFSELQLKYPAILGNRGYPSDY